MGRVAKQLGSLEVSRIKVAGYHAVGTVPGLHLQVTDGGARSWVLRAMVGSKRREIGLGAYPAVTLAMAHQKAREARAAIAQGVDPVLQKKLLASAMRAAQGNTITFAAAADTYITAHEDTWRNAKHGAQWRATLTTYAGPVIGHLAVADIELSHVLSILEPIWKTKTVTAVRLRGRIESVLDWATTRGYRSGLNPARWKGHLDNLLAAPNKIKDEEHHPAIMVAAAGAFLRDLRTHEGIGAKALEFAMLTAARSGEVRGALWPEIDLEAKMWTIPAGRMKAGQEHRGPLSDVAVKLLSALPRREGSKVVFASPSGKVLSDMTMSKLMKGMGYKDADGRLCVPHGLRSTFRDWAAEQTSYPREVVEAALAHTNSDKVEAAYLRSDMIKKRARLMEAWATFLNKPAVESSGVVPINRKRATSN